MDRNRLTVLLSGLCCSGKSSLIQKLLRGELPDVAGRLDLDGVPKPRKVHAHQLVKRRRQLPAAGRTLIHYDTVRILRDSLEGYAHDPFFQIAGIREPDMVIHLDPDPEVLLRMLNRRVRMRKWSVRRLARPFHEQRRLMFLDRLRSLYEDDRERNAFTRQWQLFAMERFRCPHLLVHHHGFEAPDWRDYVRVETMTEPLTHVFRSCCSLSG